MATAGNRTINGSVSAGAMTMQTIPMIGNAGVDLIDSGLRFQSTSIASAAVLTLRATPVTLVTAPGSGLVAIPAFGFLSLQWTSGNAYTESTANLAIKYTNGSGVQVTQTMEMTGFIDQAAAMTTSFWGKIDSIATTAASANQALVLHNLGAGEFGNAGTATLLVGLYYFVQAV